jgi:hypothetical protein
MPKPPHIQTQKAIELRPVIRETMQMQPTRTWTVASMHGVLRATDHPDATVADVNAAMLWNQSKGFIDFVYNAEFERDEWHLTNRGKNA